MYGLAVDDWTSALATPHVAGDGHIVLTALNNLPTLPAARVYRLTAVIGPGLETEIILGVFEATGVTGTTLTGVTASSGYVDVNLNAGVTVQIRVCKATITELQAALDTINSSFNSQVVHVTGAETIDGVKTFTSPIIGTIVGGAVDNTVVHLAGTETIAGSKIFTTTIIGSISGNAATVTNGVYTTGVYSDPNWLVTLAGSKITGNISGSAGGLTASIGENQVVNLTSDLNTINAVLTTKAVDSSVVHLIGNETINGIKTFTSPIVGTIVGGAVDNTVVHLAGTETVVGSKTFSLIINGSISGNAATVTNGVVTTDSYNNPLWLATLAGSKIVGDISGFAAGLTANISENQVTNLINDLAAKAPLISPNFTGTPTAPTPLGSTNSNQIATTAFVQSLVGGVGGGSVLTVFGRSGTVVAATGDYIVAQVTGAAPLASPSFTGTPTAPTPSGSTNNTQIATTAFVQTAIGGVGGGTVVSVFGRSGAVTATTGDYTVSQVTGAAPLASPNFTGTVAIGTLTGLLKATTGTVVLAVAGTDYVTPTGNGSGLTGITGAQVTGNISGFSGGLTADIPETRVTNLVSDLSGLATALLAKANDTNVVHLTGTETVTGSKTFSLLINGNISGNATTVTNGVVTTGTYNDPTWITALAGSKITGNISGNASGLTNNITETQVTNLTVDLNALTTGLATKAPLFSPTLTGTPTAPTPTGSSNTNQIATTAFVQSVIGGIGGGSVVSVFGRSGVVTPITGDYAVAQVTGAAPLASPTFSGTATIPSHVAPITIDTSPGTGIVTLNCGISDWHSVTLEGNWTLQLVNDVVGQPITILLIQDGSGSRTVTWFNGIRWANGIVPILTTTPNKIDIFTFKKIATGTYLGFTPGQDF